MLISRQRFNELMMNNQLILSLIGMSNIGKTAWSRKLAGIGFRHVNCDDIIEKKLESELRKLHYSGLGDVARWMGMPYEKRYTENEKKYLECEIETMREILDDAPQTLPINTVIDTTGSVIHTSEELCNKMRSYSLVVHIQADRERKAALYDKYLARPKPTIFANHYSVKSGESSMQALQRSYRELLEYRSALYARYSDITIPIRKLSKRMTADDFMEIIRTLL